MNPKQKPKKIGRPRLEEPTPIDPNVGRHLRSLREARHMQVKEAADKLGISPGFLSLVELGKRQAKRELLVKCAPLYHVTEEFLLELVGLRDPIENKIPLKSLTWAFSSICRHPDSREIGAMRFLEGYADAPIKAVVVGLFCRRMNLLLLRPLEQQQTDQWLGITFDALRHERSSKKIEEMLAVIAARHYSEEEDARAFYVSAYLFNARFFPRRIDHTLEIPPTKMEEKAEDAEYEDETDGLDFGEEEFISFGEVNTDFDLIWKPSREQIRKQVITLLPAHLPNSFIKRWRELRRGILHRGQIEAQRMKSSQQKKRTS